MARMPAIVKSVGNWFKPLGSSQCSGCGRGYEKKFVVNGPGVSLCRRCWDEAFFAMKGRGDSTVPIRGSNASVNRCSFCGKRAGETGGLASWPDFAICADCLLLCDEIFVEQGAEFPSAAT